MWGVLLLVQLAYSEWHVLAKKALASGVAPLTLALYRELGGVLVMHALAVAVDGRALWLASRAVLRPILPELGALSVLAFVNIVGFIWALEYITALNSALLHPVIPVLAFALGVAARVEAPSRRKGMGTALCAAGAVVVIAVGVPADNTAGESSNLMLGAARTTVML